MEYESWDESLETGNAMIDSQHRELHSLLDRLKKDTKSRDVLRMLDDIMVRTVDHLSYEEDLMDEVNYPSNSKKAMVDKHEEFKSNVSSYILDFQNQRITVQLIKSNIIMFLIDHELVEDRELADWIRRREETNKDA